MILPEEFRAVMRNLAAGVTIVTTTLDGEHYGMTATSFNSVSLDPMLVQVSLDLKSRTYKAVKGSGLYAVNILAEDQVASAPIRRHRDAGVPGHRGTARWGSRHLRRRGGGGGGRVAPAVALFPRHVLPAQPEGGNR
jgi:hypothetical protein